MNTIGSNIHVKRLHIALVSIIKTHTRTELQLTISWPPCDILQQIHSYQENQDCFSNHLYSTGLSRSLSSGGCKSYLGTIQHNGSLFSTKEGSGTATWLDLIGQSLATV